MQILSESLDVWPFSLASLDMSWDIFDIKSGERVEFSGDTPVPLHRGLPPPVNPCKSCPA